MTLFFIYLLLINSAFASEQTITTAHSLQNLCYRSAAEEVLNSTKKKSHWTNYFEDAEKYSRNTDHDAGLIFEEQAKEKIYYWTDVFEPSFDRYFGCYLDEKYFKNENVMVTKKLTRLPIKQSLLTAFATLAFGGISALICPIDHGECLGYVLLGMHLCSSIFVKKHALQEHEICISSIKNNKQKYLNELLSFSLEDSYKNNDVYLSKNFLNDKWICVIASSKIRFIDLNRNYVTFIHFDHSNPVHMAFSKPDQHISFVFCPILSPSAKTFRLFNHKDNKELHIMSHLIRHDRTTETQTHIETDVEKFCTTDGSCIAIQKNNTIQVGHLFSWGKGIDYRPGTIKNAQLIHFDQNAELIVYIHDNQLYQRYFSKRYGIIDENKKINNEWPTKKLLFPQKYSALDNELPFTQASFECIPKKCTKDLLLFKVTDATNPSSNCFICINTKKRTWYYLTPAETKLLHNSLYEVKDLDALVQEKLADPSKQFNLFKSEDRVLILKKTEGAYKKSNLSAAESILAFA